MAERCQPPWSVITNNSCSHGRQSPILATITSTGVQFQFRSGDGPIPLQFQFRSGGWADPTTVPVPVGGWADPTTVPVPVGGWADPTTIKLFLLFRQFVFCTCTFVFLQAEHFPFLSVTHSNLDMRCRTTFYTALGRLLIVELGEDEERFERFISPMTGR